MKIKNVFIFSAFILVGITLHAQEKNNYLRIEMTRAFTGTGDMMGSGFGAEYNRGVTKGGRVALGFAHCFFGDDFENFNYPTSSDKAYVNTLEMGYYQAIFAAKKLQPEVGIGCYTRRWDWHNYSSSWREISRNEYSTVGYTVSIGVRWNIANGISLNLRGTLQNDNNADIVESARLGLGIRF